MSKQNYIQPRQAQKKAYFRFISRTNVASVGSVFNDTRKVKVLSLPETIQEKIDVSSEGPSSGVSSDEVTPDEGPSLETSIFSCIVSGSERTFTFRVFPI